MKDKIVLLFILVAGISILLGFIGRFLEIKIIIQPATWIQIAQTFLLFGIAWGIGKNSLKKD